MPVKDPIDNLQKLIRCPSVTPEEGGALALLESMLAPLGFKVERMTMREADTPDIDNLYARLGETGPHLMFAGHTDVVPVGDEAAWSHPPFGAEIHDGVMFGRGAVDMKGGVACFAAAVARHIEKHGRPQGSISFLITGDEEGPAVNGTVKLLEWAHARGERWDGCLVGEPTNPDTLGDMIKIGRRGSVSGMVTVQGVQGHVAYPHLAENPVRAALAMATELMETPFDHGTDDFQPSNMEVTTIDAGNKATNVIPAKVSFAFNIRFNDAWTADTVKAEIIRRLDQGAASAALRPGRAPARYELVWAERPSHVFLTRDDRLIGTLSRAIERHTGTTPKLSTTGGTSDARFIKDYCPVVEFGLVGQTMHMVDERVRVSELEALTRIYESFIADWFRDAGA
ncbi:succinyl-diaminopimelate desuccinylase [Rhizobium sp. SG_E_25_P2]|uniref:succinyl-diaminopimelate desuccinylase n=1 Tax=Rhizobium sp. SG_E_25_P2 TaxID=2879942 RepID=UPI002475096D|nr:succinyl-diaminopimelate desuccinylase [Rhizobium sp. SG_E_25_P2]MDH6264881.1 succinyl-diaminopimelate desuccinylase [Rhizobium sp. SG_E_25_P2]